MIKRTILLSIIISTPLLAQRAAAGDHLPSQHGWTVPARPN
jgi:hypothetical protein